MISKNLRLCLLEVSDKGFVFCETSKSVTFHKVQSRSESRVCVSVLCTHLWFVVFSPAVVLDTHDYIQFNKGQTDISAFCLFG